MRKYLNILLLLLGIQASTLFAQVGFNNNNPDNSSLLDLKSSNKGLLIPRMSTLEKTSIASPATSLLVFDTDLSSFQYYNGTTWQTILNGTKTTNGIQLGYNLGIGTAPLASTSLTLASALSGTSATFSSNVSMANLTASGTASITGNTTISGTLGAGNTSVTGTLSASGNTTLSGTLSSGATTVNGSLTVNTTTGAFVLPRLTTAERDALVNPVYGTMIYNTTTNKVQVRASVLTAYTFENNPNSTQIGSITTAYGGSYDEIGMSFTPSQSGWITNISLYVEIGTFFPGFSFSADLMAYLCSGKGISTPQATSNLVTMGSGDQTWAYFNFSNFAVTAGQTYTFWVNYPNSSVEKATFYGNNPASGSQSLEWKIGGGPGSSSGSIGGQINGQIMAPAWVDLH